MALIGWNGSRRAHTSPASRWSVAPGRCPCGVARQLLQVRLGVISPSRPDLAGALRDTTITATGQLAPRRGRRTDHIVTEVLAAE